MWEYILIPTTVILIIGILWLLQPYRVWKKSYGKRSQQQIVITNKNSIKKSLAEYSDQQRKNQNKQILLSLIVPSYNEEERLPIMLRDTVKYLSSEQLKFNPYEIIIVNDGSKDKTTDVAFKTAKQLEIQNFFVVEYPKNRGKGGAVKAGMAVVKGKYILMVDADGATTFSELGKFHTRMQNLEKQLNHPLIMLVGSRAMFSQDVKVQRKIHRKLVSSVFGFIKSVICKVKAKDTQCGFKYFTKQSSKQLFEVLHIERWAFDIQLFYLSNIFKIHAEEIPVQWRDIDGSKLNVIEASVNMFRDLLMIRMLYLLGLWKKNDRMIVS